MAVVPSELNKQGKEEEVNSLKVSLARCQKFRGEMDNGSFHHFQLTKECLASCKTDLAWFRAKNIKCTRFR